MDLLDRIEPAARDLLGRVDATLTAGGAAADDPIWPLVARVGALPGAAVAHLAAVSPGALAAAGDPVRAQAREYEAQPAAVPMPAAWRGPAAQRFADQWSALSGHLAGAPDGMAGRLGDTARYLDEVSGWLARSRQAVAGAVATCLGSAEAVTLRAAAGPEPVHGPQSGGTAGGPGGGTAAGPGAVVRAAAVIGAHVLGSVADLLAEGQHLRDAWAGRLDELSYRPPAAAEPPGGGHIALG